MVQGPGVARRLFAVAGKSAGVARRLFAVADKSAGVVWGGVRPWRPMA
jgi:hypothetical protein